MWGKIVDAVVLTYRHRAIIFLSKKMLDTIALEIFIVNYTKSNLHTNCIF